MSTTAEAVIETKVKRGYLVVQINKNIQIHNTNHEGRSVTLGISECNELIEMLRGAVKSHTEAADKISRTVAGINNCQEVKP